MKMPMKTDGLRFCWITAEAAAEGAGENGNAPALIEFDGLEALIEGAVQAAGLARRRESRVEAQGNVVRITGVLDDRSHVDALAAIDALGAEDITVAINSPGGDAYLGVAIYNSLMRAQGKVTVRIDGLAASAASLIAMAGDEIVMPRNTFMMIHEPVAFAMGNSSDLERHKAELDRLSETYAAAYSARSGQSPERMREMMADETYMSADEAVALGMATRTDEVVRMAAEFEASDLAGAPPTDLLAALASALEAEGPDGDGEESGEDAGDAAGAEDAAKGGGQAPDVAQVERDRAAEIAALCAAFRKPSEAVALIRSTKTLEEIRAELRTKSPPRPKVDNRQTEGRSQPGVEFGKIYGKFNKR